MTKKIQTMEDLLAKVNLDRLQNLPGVSEQDIAKIEMLHDLLRKGKTWKDEELRDVFRVLPDSFPLCTAFIHTEALIRIGKCKPIKVVSRIGEKDSRLRWVPIEKADELGLPPTLPLIGYEIICSMCNEIFIGREPFHQNFCSRCVHRGRKPIEQQPVKKVEPVKAEKEQLKQVEAKPQAKRRGRPPKSGKSKSSQPVKPAKKRTSRKSRK